MESFAIPRSRAPWQWANQFWLPPTLQWKILCHSRRHCRHVESRDISYWEGVPPDGLFLAWLAVK
jgi:hypothetical protein